jgi:predicted nucleic acid-binding protein
VIYFDTSALAKLVITEDETRALQNWLGGFPDAIRMSSSLIRLEMTRTVLRRNPGAIFHARRVVSEVRRITLTNEVLDVAAQVQPSGLRSLDAIHLASALKVYDQLIAFVTYDQRLLAAATAMGLPAISPN